MSRPHHLTQLIFECYAICHKLYFVEIKETEDCASKIADYLLASRSTTFNRSLSVVCKHVVILSVSLPIESSYSSSLYSVGKCKTQGSVSAISIFSERSLQASGLGMIPALE